MSYQGGWYYLIVKNSNILWTVSKHCICMVYVILFYYSWKKHTSDCEELSISFQTSHILKAHQMSIDLFDTNADFYLFFFFTQYFKSIHFSRCKNVSSA